MSNLQNIFADLVAYETITGNTPANHEALDYIDRFLTERGLYVNRYEWGGYESLVATAQPTNKPRVLLAAHLDVVPGPPRLFRLTERDGKFYGRGVCDMKFAIAAYLNVIDSIKDNIHQYDLGIMITTDEEVGGRDGVKPLLEEAGYSADVCVLPDGGDNWAIEQSAKGLLWLVAAATGVTAHGSRPWEGSNAIEKMLGFLQAVRSEIFPQQGNDTSTCNIGTIHGGSAANQIPDVCTADIDIRSLNLNEQTRITTQLQELAAKHEVSLEFRINDAPISVDLSHPLVTAYAQSVEKVLGAPLQTTRSNGGSDARHFAAHSIPTLVGYPIGGGRHSDDEWLSKQAFYQFNDIVGDYIERTAHLVLTANQPTFEDTATV